MGRLNAGAISAFLLASLLMAGCGGKAPAADPASTGAAGGNETEPSAAELIAQLIENETQPEDIEPIAGIGMPLYPDDFLLNGTELPFEFKAPKYSEFGGEDIGLTDNPGRVDAVVAAKFLRPVPAEAWWTIANLRSSPSTYVTVEAMRWNDVANATAAVATIPKTGDRCHWPGQSVDTIRGVYRNESVLVWLGFELAQLEYAKLLLAALSERSNLTEVCPLSYAGEVAPAATTPLMALTVTESTDKMLVSQAPTNLNWTSVALDSTAPLFARVNTGAPVLVATSGTTTLSGPKIAANDVLEFCSSSTLANVHVEVLASSVVVQRHTFLLVDHKAWC
jgi:hypothetical protein